MNVLTSLQARDSLEETMDKVCEDHAPILIQGQNQKSVVMMSLEDYEALEETA